MEKLEPTEARDIRELFRINGGRDELNLAEFPITLLSDRVPDRCKTLVFEDKVFDQQAGEYVVRRLTVTGSDAFGLPTAVDDEILVALLQLTKLDGFKNPKVQFSRYEVLQILGWKDVGKNYQRIEDALNRWIGVTLVYERAWWDNNAKAWVDAKFHILDNVTLVGQEERKRLRKRKQLDLFFSWFKWNEIVFKSFQADNLKRLDLDIYFNLKSSVAKRMFRFLDKRFYHRRRWEFDLDEFAFQHIGLSGSYDAGQVKAKLQPGLEELEVHGFLEPLSREDRYSKVGKGRWKVIILKASSKSDQGLPEKPSDLADLETELQARGVTPATASELVLTFPPEKIRIKLEVFDWFLSNKDKRVAKSPAGYLVTSIKDDYTPPKGFEPKEAKTQRLKAEAERKHMAEEEKHRASEEAKATDEADKKKLDDYWNSLSPAEQKELRVKVLTEASSPFVGHYLRNEKTNPKLADLYWKNILMEVLGDRLGINKTPR